MKIRSTNLTTFALLILLLSSCGPAYHIRQGNRLFDEMAYSMAIDEYQKGLTKEPFLAKQNYRNGLPQAKINLGECHRLMNNTAKAEQAYSEIVLMKEAKPIHKLRYAMMLMRDGKYPSAKMWLENYLQSMPNDSAAKDLLASCDMVDQMKKDSAKWNIENQKVNTGQSNFSPTGYKDGIVFASDRSSKGHAQSYAWTGQPFLDLYFSKADNKGEWSKPELLKGDVNGIYHDGPATFGNDSVMYVTRDNYIKRRINMDENDVVNLKIYESRNRGGSWTALSELPFNSNDYSTGHPAVSKDGNTMFFVSDMPGGMGGTDIWISKKVDGKWSKPVNAGPVINTPFNEMFPVVFHDTLLYFSSEGHHTLGGLDIFHSTVSNMDAAPAFGEAVNLGYPVNSSHDDFGIMLADDGKSGYLSSNRQTTTQDNIYGFKMREYHFTVIAKVVEKGTNNVIEGALVKMTNKSTDLGDSMITGPDGTVTFADVPKEADFSTVASKDMFYTNTEKLTTKGKDPTTQDSIVHLTISLDHIVLGQRIVLPNIYYDLDKSFIRADAAVELDKLVALMKENPGITIELGSHTDSRADDRYNMILSQKRAQAAVDYIVSQGVAKDRITAKGYGETMLVNGCTNGVKCSEAEHQQNRRTEFKVTSFGKKKPS